MVLNEFNTIPGLHWIIGRLPPGNAASLWYNMSMITGDTCSDDTSDAPPEIDIGIDVDGEGNAGCYTPRGVLRQL